MLVAARLAIFSELQAHPNLHSPGSVGRHDRDQRHPNLHPSRRILTSHIWTNTPKCVPSRRGWRPSGPTQTGLCKIQVGLESEELCCLSQIRRSLRLLNALNSEDRGLKVRFSLAMIAFDRESAQMSQILSSQGKNAPSNPYPHYLVRLAASRMSERRSPLVLVPHSWGKLHVAGYTGFPRHTSGFGKDKARQECLGPIFREKLKGNN